VTLEEIIRAAAADGRLDRTSIVKDPAGRDALEPYKAVAEVSVDEMLE
jgi:hypothetical protein